jgi:ATP/maltotriose-dependent transcriptional regulator MalT
MSGMAARCKKSNDAMPRVASLGRLARPRLGRVFRRERLFTLLDDLAACPGLWLAAPPGAGKTTLVATWLEREVGPVLWLQLDAGDADPIAFAQALDLLLNGQLAEPMQLPVLRSEDLDDLTGWLRRRVRFLLPRLPAHWTLVLDNVQELPASSPLHAALAALLPELPADVQWLFLSRTLPPPAYTQAMARQQLRVLDAEPLRMDEAETRELIRLHGRDQAVYESLEPAQGWAAGLTLMLLGRPGAVHLAAPDARERLFDYFAEEVLVRMRENEQHALSQLASLPGSTAALAVALTGDPSAPALLERLAQQSLFTQRREAAPPVYVFHALFRDFLRARHASSAAPAEVVALSLRAGRLLLDTGEIDAGLQLLLSCQAWDEVECYLRQHARTYAAEGRLSALARYIAALPIDHADRLAYWRGLCALDSHPAAALDDMATALAAARAAGDPLGQLEAAEVAATALVSMARMRDLDPWIAVLEEHADYLDSATGRDTAFVIPGLLAALVMRCPWHVLAPRLAERAERLLHREALGGQRLLVGTLLLHFLWRGEIDRVDRIIACVDELANGGLASPAALMRFWTTGTTLVKLLLGRFDAAGDDLQRAHTLLGSEPSVAAQRAPIEFLCALRGVAMGNAAQARCHLERAARSVDPEHASGRSEYERLRGMLALLEDDHSTALRLTRASVESGRMSGYAVREHIALLAHVLAAARHGEHDEAQRQIVQWRAHPMTAMCRWHLWVGGCVAAYAALCRSDDEAAAQDVQAAFATAREFGFHAFSPILSVVPELLPRLTAFALERDIEPTLARELIVHHRLKAPPQADHRWPWPVRLRVLGGFAFERDGAPLPATRKESRRLFELLQLLAAHGTDALAQDRVADALWPDADGDAARNALDNAVHRLRKLLGGEDRVLLRHGALALNRERCWVDVDALRRQLEQLANTPEEHLATSLRELRRIYRAALLPDATEPIITARRDELHRQVDAALRSATERLEHARQKRVCGPSKPRPSPSRDRRGRSDVASTLAISAQGGSHPNHHKRR